MRISGNGRARKLQLHQRMERKLEVITKGNSDHIKKWIYRWLAEHCLISLYKIRLFYVLGQGYHKSIETVGGEITDAEYVYQSTQATGKIIV